MWQSTISHVFSAVFFSRFSFFFTFFFGFSHYLFLDSVGLSCWSKSRVTLVEVVGCSGRGCGRESPLRPVYSVSKSLLPPVYSVSKSLLPLVYSVSKSLLPPVYSVSKSPLPLRTALSHLARGLCRMAFRCERSLSYGSSGARGLCRMALPVREVFVVWLFRCVVFSWCFTLQNEAFSGVAEARRIYGFSGFQGKVFREEKSYGGLYVWCP
jgi:hypothetical protein